MKIEEKLDSRIEKINKLIFELAIGNYKYRGNISEKRDDIDAIITGINMLAEELQHTTLHRNYLKNIYEGIPDMVFILNEKGKIEDINSAVSQSLGYNSRQLIDKPLNVIFEDDQQIDIIKLKDAIKEFGTITNYEQHLITKNKTSIPVSCSFSHIKNKNLNSGFILLIVKDISFLKKTEDDLRNRNKELNTFIYRASHDLKGPLASMMGLLNLIDIDENDIKSAKKYINLIKESALKLNGVVSELLDLGRITATEYLFEEIKVAEFIDNILNDLKFLPEFQDINVTIDNNQKDSFVSEPRILKSVLQNLIENSIKYRRTDTESYLKIVINDAETGVNIKLEDNGIGIEEEIQSKVFNMFFRGHIESSGSGLGLYIVKTGLEKINGNIHLDSVLDQGSTFYISIPDHRYKEKENQDGSSSLS